MNYFKINIKAIRKHWGFSQNEFADLVEATRGMINQYEQGINIPKDRLFNKLFELTLLSKKELTETIINTSSLPPKPKLIPAPAPILKEPEPVYTPKPKPLENMIERALDQQDRLIEGQNKLIDLLTKLYNDTHEKQ
jgi:transcriptional regulator with XRE-family HTH domain